MFYNYGSDDFEYTWGGKPYQFEAGKVYEGIVLSKDKTESVMLNETVSRFFSKHLAEHLLNQNKEVAKDQLKYNITNLEMLTERGIAPPGTEKPLPEFANVLNLHPHFKKDPALEVVTHTVRDEAETKPADEKKKIGRPKKALSPSPEAVFENV